MEKMGETQTLLGSPTDGEVTPSGINAPIGFSPESREVWKDVPELVKEQIQKREREITDAMANSGESRRTHAALNELSNSYASVLAAEGVSSPMEAVEGLFRTVAELRLGSPQQTATKMAQLIQHYGIDINMLDSALAGEPTQSDEMTAMERMMDSKLAPLQEMLSNQRSAETMAAESSQNKVNEELQEFAKSADFINDVRGDMADLIDLASKQGRSMGFKEAYDKACALNPSIVKVMRDREAAARLTEENNKSEGKKAAASSIPGRSADTSGDGSPSTLRGELEKLWDSANE